MERLIAPHHYVYFAKMRDINKYYKEYETFMYWCAVKVIKQFPWLEEDILQEARLRYWKMLHVCDLEMLNRQYIKKMVGYNLWRKFARICKQEYRVWTDLNAESDIHFYCKTDVFDTMMTIDILSTKALSVEEKHVIYLHFIGDYTCQEISEMTNLSYRIAKSRLQTGLRKIQERYNVINSKKRKNNYGPDEFRVWEPYRPQCHRGKSKSWCVRARQGSRGTEYSKYFKTCKEANEFYKLALNHKQKAFLPCA